MPPRRRHRSRWHMLSIVIGGMLVGVVVIWLGWLLFHPNAGVGGSLFPIPGIGQNAPVGPPIVGAGPLLAEGITLDTPLQQPKLNQQQALLIANQLEADAATKAKSTQAQYALLNYPNTSATPSHADFKDVPIWLIHYQHIPLEPADVSVDPTPFPHSFHDLYVFLDANTGKELLVIWV